MTDEIRETILNAASDGIITTKRITELGIHRGVLRDLVDSGDIVPCSRGVYLLADAWEDEYRLLQQKYRRGIFSHGTALYLHGYSDRVPLSFHMTFPCGYNSPSIKKENVIVTRVVPENYELGKTTVVSPYGNPVIAYDVERSLCDMLRGSGEDIQTIQYAMRKYAASKEKDINRLMKYASQLRVEPKVRRYMEVLL